MGRNRLISPLDIPKPNPKCFVCAPQPTVQVTVCTLRIFVHGNTFTVSFLQLNVNTVTVGFLAETILKKELGMIAPDANLDDRQGLQLNNRK